MEFLKQLFEDDIIKQIGKRAFYLLQTERLFIDRQREDLICINAHTFTHIGKQEIAAAKRIGRYIKEHFSGSVYFLSYELYR